MITEDSKMTDEETNKLFSEIKGLVEESDRLMKEAFPDGIMTVQIHPDSVLAKVLEELDYDPLSKT